MKTKRCSHKRVRIDEGLVDGNIVPIARRCVRCGALIKLADANDNHPAIEVELGAALLARLIGHMPAGPQFPPESRGWDDRCEDVIDDHEHTTGEAIGWLAHAIVNHDAEQAELALEQPAEASAEGAL